MEKGDLECKFINAALKKKNHQKLRRIASGLNLTNGEVICALLESLPDEAIKELIGWKVEKKRISRKKASTREELSESSMRPMSAAEVKKHLLRLKESHEES